MPLDIEMIAEAVGKTVGELETVTETRVCDQCRGSGQETITLALCLACHKPIADAVLLTDAERQLYGGPYHKACAAGPGLLISLPTY